MILLKGDRDLFVLAANDLDLSVTTLPSTDTHDCLPTRIGFSTACPEMRGAYVDVFTFSIPNRRTIIAMFLATVRLFHFFPSIQAKTTAKTHIPILQIRQTGLQQSRGLLRSKARSKTDTNG
ncbi:unnamed protein product [Amoebophrya sp. A120]|nr:unnamed protein product [Amoebophrya sp. A120]|eukprot:GSA120T00001504001.1